MNARKENMDREMPFGKYGAKLFNNVMTKITNDRVDRCRKLSNKDRLIKYEYEGRIL